MSKFICVWLLPFFSFAGATDSAENDISQLDNDNHDNEVYVMLIMSGFMALCISLAGVLLCYISVLENTLMRAYFYDGIAIEGRVRNVSFFRSSGMNSESEYKAELDYQCQDIGGYSTVVRKKINIIDSDLCMLRKRNKIVKKRESDRKVVVHIDIQNFEKELQSECSDQSSEKDIWDEHVKLEVVLVPNFPKSGIPKFMLDRSFEFGSRLKTASIIAFLFWTSCLCVHWGITGSQLSVPSLSSSIIISILVSVTLWVIVAMPIHCFLRAFLEQILVDEYLEGGDTLIKMDDETLATLSSRTISSAEGDL